MKKGDSLAVATEAVAVGFFIAIVATLPRNLLFAANLRWFTAVPWAVPLTAAYLFFFWRYLQGHFSPPATAEERRQRLRARPLPGRTWMWALAAGATGIVALVLALRLFNLYVTRPQQTLPEMEHVPSVTVLTLLLTAAPVAGVIEESAFRGYMQRPIELHYGLLALETVVASAAMLAAFRGLARTVGPRRR
jgi:membrane protease YdiL (CAAX protease family)